MCDAMHIFDYFLIMSEDVMTGSDRFLDLFKQQRAWIIHYRLIALTARQNKMQKKNKKKKLKFSCKQF